MRDENDYSLELSLTFLDPDLDLRLIASLLAVTPDCSFARGSARGHSKLPAKNGSWSITTGQSHDPVDLDVLWARMFTRIKHAEKEIAKLTVREKTLYMIVRVEKRYPWLILPRSMVAFSANTGCAIAVESYVDIAAAG